MSTRRKIGLAIGSGLLLTVTGVALVLLSPPAAPTYAEAVSLEHRSQNTEIFAALVSAGIADAFVDVDDERAYVAYGLENVTEQEHRDMRQRFVLGAAASAAPNATRAIAVQYAEGKPLSAWTLELEDFRAFLGGKITGAQLEERIQKQAL